MDDCKSRSNNGWSEERRKQQSERIRSCKPWEKSTGPITEEGKEASSKNALKHGEYTIELINNRKMLMDWKRRMRAWMKQTSE